MHKTIVVIFAINLISVNQDLEITILILWYTKQIKDTEEKKLKNEFERKKKGILDDECEFAETHVRNGRKTMAWKGFYLQMFNQRNEKIWI